MHRSVIACEGNTAAAGDAQVTCPAAVAACPTPGYLVRDYTAPITDPAAFTQTGTRCTTPTQPQPAPAPGAAGPAFPGFTLADFQRLPLPPAVAHLQPANGYALLTVPTNVYAHAAPVTLPTTVVGVPVRVHATPVAYQWSFGDGATLGPTPDPGAPYPQLRLTHTYTTPGPRQVTLTTRYTGEYSVAGGPWQPIPGQATVTSPPLPVEVLTGHSALVEGTTAD